MSAKREYEIESYFQTDDAFAAQLRAGRPRYPSNSLEIFSLEALLDKALSRSLNYAIRNQAGQLTCMFPAIYIRSSVVETNHLDGD